MKVCDRHSPTTTRAFGSLGLPRKKSCCRPYLRSQCAEFIVRIGDFAQMAEMLMNMRLLNCIDKRPSAQRDCKNPETHFEKKERGIELNWIEKNVRSVQQSLFNCAKRVKRKETKVNAPRVDQSKCKKEKRNGAHLL